MPTPAGNKRNKGISVYRPFVYGSIATPLPKDPEQRPPGIPPDHTHTWTVYVRGIDGADISPWLRKVQFKLHETYAQSLRTIEAPNAFEVTETGWGEFEVSIKMHFNPLSAEKPQSVYHALALHPYQGTDEEKAAAKERGDVIESKQYEEVVFNEPNEPFYEILSGKVAPDPTKAKVSTKNKKKKDELIAELPTTDSPSQPFSQRAEEAELERLRKAIKQMEELNQKEKEALIVKEKELDELKKSELSAVPAAVKK